MLFLSISFLVQIISRPNNFLEMLCDRESKLATDRSDAAYSSQFERIKAGKQEQHCNCSLYTNQEDLTPKLNSGDRRYKIAMLN